MKATHASPSFVPDGQCRQILHRKSVDVLYIKRKKQLCKMQSVDKTAILSVYHAHNALHIQL